MARLTIYSFEGEGYAHSLNDEITGKKFFDISDWVKQAKAVYGLQGYTEDDLINAWSVGKNSVRFAIASQSTITSTNSEGTTERTEYNDIYAQWNGKFKVKGDRITGGTVTSFERDWSRSYGHIRIDGFKYPIKKEAGSIWSLTLPNEITDHFDGTIGDPVYNSYGRVSNTVLSLIGELAPGSIYEFSTPYG